MANNLTESLGAWKGDDIAECLEMTKTEKSNWISVKDKMPDIAGRYLVVWRDRVTGMQIVAEAEYKSYFGELKFFGAVSKEIYIEGDITHWQPMPEPPEKL